MLKKNHLKLATITLFTLSFLILTFLKFQSNDTTEARNTFMTYQPARIISLLEDRTFIPDEDDPLFYADAPGVRMGTMRFEIELLSGDFSGYHVEANYYMRTPAHILFNVGDDVSVRIFERDGAIYNVEIRTPERTTILLLAVAVFILFLCIIGGKRGVLAVSGLAFTLGLIWFVLIPLTTLGHSILVVTLLTMMLVITGTITLLTGFSLKGASAIFGSLIGVLVAGVVSILTGFALHLSGYNMAHILQIGHLAPGANLRGLFTASILISAIGAVMDTAISIASSMEQIKQTSPAIGEKELFRAGFNVSKDIMATMSTTLILAFVGGSMSLLLFMNVTNTSFNQFINNDFIAMEIIKGIAGSMGIVISAPATAWIAAKLLTNRHK